MQFQQRNFNQPNPELITYSIIRNTAIKCPLMGCQIQVNNNAAASLQLYVMKKLQSYKP